MPSCTTRHLNSCEIDAKLQKYAKKGDAGDALFVKT